MPFRQGNSRLARKTKEDAEATRERLLDAAEEVFLEKGVSRASLEAIARRAGVTRGALYWHFRDKSDLFDAMVARVRSPLSELAEELARDSGDDPLDGLRRLCRSTLQQLAVNARHRRVYTILLHRREHVGDGESTVAGEDEIGRVSLRLLEGQFARAAELGMLNSAVSPHVAAWALRSYLAGIFSQYLHDPEQFDLAAYADELLGGFFDGIRAPS